MGKKKQKHGRQMSRNEILAQMKHVRNLKQSADKSPFTGIAVLTNYIFWKEDKWGQIRLTRYNQIVNQYETAINDGEITVEELSERVWDKADFKVEFIQWQNKPQGDSLRDRLNAEIIESNNTINQYAARHLTVHFAALIDLGWGLKRLERNKDQINAYLDRLDEDELHIMDMHKDLVNGVGIYVEMPFWQVS